MADLLCLGEPMLELNQQPDGRYLEGFGGDTSNCAISAARQGASVGCLTHLGADQFGQKIRTLWTEEGVDSAVVRSVERAPTGIYFVTHSAAGHDFSYRREGSAASLMSRDDLTAAPVAAALSACRVLHLSGISQGISDIAADTCFAAIEAVRTAGGQVSYDPNLRLKLWPLDKARAVIHQAMAMCQIALPGLDDAQLLTGHDAPDDIVDFYLSLGAQTVALTLGKAGTLVATSSAREMIPAFPVDAVDATAAGDTFDGAFLAELLAGRTPFAAARYANAAAALSTTGYGAVAPMPRRTDVEAFITARNTG